MLDAGDQRGRHLQLRLKLEIAGKKISAKIEAIRLCKDDEREGDCAGMAVPE